MASHDGDKAKVFGRISYNGPHIFMGGKIAVQRVFYHQTLKGEVRLEGGTYIIALNPGTRSEARIEVIPNRISAGLAPLVGKMAEVEGYVERKGVAPWSPGSIELTRILTSVGRYPRLDLFTDADTYTHPGGGAATMKVTFVLVNTTDDPITLNFMTGQRYDFVLYDNAGSVVYRWSDGRYFTQATGTLRLGPREKHDFNETISLKHKDDKPFAPGRYRLLAILTATDRSSVDKSIEIKAGGRQELGWLKGKVEVRGGAVFFVANPGTRSEGTFEVTSYPRPAAMASHDGERAKVYGMITYNGQHVWNGGKIAVRRAFYLRKLHGEVRVEGGVYIIALQPGTRSEARIEVIPNSISAGLTPLVGKMADVEGYVERLGVMPWSPGFVELTQILTP
jgi:hypothetical protein